MRIAAMGAVKMIHPYEGMWSPWLARKDLRRSFDRWLSHHRHQSLINGSEEMIDDSSLLDLCRHYRLEYLGSAKNIETIWDASEQRITDNGPSFNSLVESGWIHFDGGRWMMQRTPIGTISHITYPSLSTKSFLTSLENVRLVAKVDTLPPDVKALADKISTNDRLDRRLPTKMPERLASRLWELLCTKLPHAYADADPETIDAVFLEWLTWCDVLGVAGKWSLLWDRTEMRYCRDAAQRVLQRQTLWGTWDNDVSRYIDVLTKTYAISEKQLSYHSDVSLPPPQSLVSRVDFLSRPEIESLMMGRHRAGIVSFVFNLLCSELETTDIGPDTADHAAAVLLFASIHPMALQQLLYRINTAPALLVDMLLTQHAACLATRLTIEWGGIERGADLNLHREAQTKAFAVEDALSLLAYHRDKDTLDCEECASLISWCYAKSTIHQKSVADSRKSIGQQLLLMLSRENETFQSAVLKRLLDQMTSQGNRPGACFAAALDGLIFLSKSPSVLTCRIVHLYSQFACDMNLDLTDASNLSAEQAARLIAAATDEDVPVRNAFFVPFDSQKLLRQATSNEQPSLNSSIARNLRIHVRMLARAINGWSNGDVPEELFKAFESLISRSVIEHVEKGRVGALTDRYNLSYLIAREDGSPAQDIAAACPPVPE